MGCNTSNEVKTDIPDENENGTGEADTSKVNAVGSSDNKPSAPLSEEVIHVIDVENFANGDNEDGNEEIEEFDKSTSAKTITLKSTRPNSSTSAATSIKAELGSDGGPETTVTIEHSNDDFLDVEETLAEELAAAKIQAAFRGHQTRKIMKQADNPVEAEPTKEQLEAEFRADDEELCHAATKIQASFRGHMSRKTNEPEKAPEAADNAGDDEIADIDLTDPDLSKAAVKIQASFRGHMARKEHDK